MAENSHISWTNHTFNPWIGCTKVSPACDGCYAAELMGTAGSRFRRVEWGEPGKGEGTRDRTKDWSKPRKWNRQAVAAPGQTFVFCASLADVFDNAVDPAWRIDLFDLIRDTPNLTWLLLTKRPGMIMRLFRDVHVARPREWWPTNAAIGCTVVNQEEADRDIPKLLEAKKILHPPFAFLSMEPLLGPVDLGDYLPGIWNLVHEGSFIDWVIAGGETDQGCHKARPADPAWYRSLRDQCAATGVPFHFKQWGEWIGGEVYSEERGGQTSGGFTRCEDGQSHGGKPTMWWSGDCWRGRISVRVGKDYDPCTLDGVKHDARPALTVSVPA